MLESAKKYPSSLTTNSFVPMRDTVRDTVPELEPYLEKEIKVLDKGFIRVVDYMGSDNAIVQAARVSYGKGTKKRNEDRGLIRYLMRHHHTTPHLKCVKLSFMSNCQFLLPANG